MHDEPILAWHFVGDTLRDGRPVPADGEILTHADQIKMCCTGLHASRRVVDALGYAPGNTICRVECWGDVVEDSDKLVARHRRILWRVEGEAVLRDFARECALSVIHLWDAPAIVREFLETGDLSKRAAAMDAARDAARDAAWDAAWAAVWDAARAAAGAAAMAAAWAAAMDAAMAAAWNAARAAAMAAAWAAAMGAAGDAAWDAAWAAAMDAANTRLEAPIEAARTGG